MPVDTPKAKKDTVNFLEVYRNDMLLNSVLLNDEVGDFTTIYVTSGLVFSPDYEHIAWIASPAQKFEKKSKLGYTVQMYHEKDFGEDLDGIYNTSLIVYSLKTNEIKSYGSPQNHSICNFTFASSNIIVCNAIEMNTERLIGIRSCNNRPFHLFAINISNTDFKLLSNDRHLYPRAYQLNDRESLVFTGIFPKDFHGHNAPVYPSTFVLDLQTLEIRATNTSKEEITMHSIIESPFKDKDHLLLTESRRTRLIPIILNLKDFRKTSLIEPKEYSSITLQSFRNDNYLLIHSTPIDTPRFVLYNENTFKFISNSTHFDNCEVKIIERDTSNDCILLVNTLNERKKFVVVPHGGPHGNFTTNFMRSYIFFCLCGYSVGLVNYRGSTGYSFESLSSLIGQCSKIDVEDVCENISYIKNNFNIEKIGVWGISHGGFLSTSIVGQHPDVVDFAAAGGPVTNWISSYYTTDIPDWCLAEINCENANDEGDVDMNNEILNKLWDVSPVRFADKVSKPVLLFHGKDDRRVCYRQSLDYYYALKRHGKLVKLLIYANNNHSFHGTDAFDDVLCSSVDFFNDPKGYVLDN
ncbi:acylamino-acid-releasing enzyme [Histomonas meleagridis]|uniref:acylamino-acid-releasing enzyme n=1 Tax=Histomonas meleagridis TaxID=135588 RepID=UPI003559E2D7|nr:acylamino-acid-releasing enzyme [Histomonas meleagridis]KAH0805089.1 acylamino-acid-releasing enzyme [Histomonas meleagridis]